MSNQKCFQVTGRKTEDIKNRNPKKSWEYSNAKQTAVVQNTEKKNLLIIEHIQE